MIRPQAGGLGAAFAWFLFPLAPAFLGRTYYETCNLSFGSASAPDPRDWGWFTWVILVGPLLGYGFLAGATIDLPEDSGRRGFRGWLSHRAIWVGIGPWSGFLVAGALLFLFGAVDKLLPGVRQAIPSPPPHWGSTWWWGILMGAWVFGVVGLVGYGWLFVALAAIRRAQAAGAEPPGDRTGTGGSMAFVGSLFGSFWAITEVWRSYFFDSRFVPLLMACLGLALLSLSGCASQLTYGEVRRRELFNAMLMAWLVGLAFAWRWWSRPRGKT